MTHTGLAVVEARWWENGNDSVRPLFETLAGIVEDNPHAVRYDMFAEEKSLRQIVIQVAGTNEIHSIYVAAHGDENSIKGVGDNTISRSVFRNILRDANADGLLSGLYFGSCLVGNMDNASFFLTQSQTNLKWVAGYEKSVNWVDSSAIDMIFWSKYLQERKKNRSRKRGKKTDIEMIEIASDAMKALMPTIFTQLGFNVYYLDQHNAQQAVW